MCTAITYQTKDHYFGRNLDLEYSYEESVTVTPRNFPLRFHRLPTLEHHYAMIGMAYVQKGYPLYYDATNEKGLSIAGLNFVGNAVYTPQVEERDNVAPYELVPWVLGMCADLREARALLERVHIVDIPFSEELPLARLHWMISDETGSLAVEPMKDGLKIYDDPVGVLTNNPPFETQMLRLADYTTLSSGPPVNRLCPHVTLEQVSRGMGAMGLPGDLSSPSRFVRGAFTRLTSRSGESEEESVSQFFHILNSVAHVRGSVRLEDGSDVITVYSSCCNTSRGIYYYTTYENSGVTGVDMHREDLDGKTPVSYPLMNRQRIRIQN